MDDEAAKSEDLPALLTLAMILKHYVPVCVRTFKRWRAAGQFPKPDVSIRHVNLWRRETVEGWIAGQQA